MEGRLHCNTVLLRSSLIETIRHSTFSIESRPQTDAGDHSVDCELDHFLALLDFISAPID